MQCLSFNQSSPASSRPASPQQTLDLDSHPPDSDGGLSTDGTPRSSSQASATVNLTQEYRLAVETSSYNEILSNIQVFNESLEQENVQAESGNDNGDARELLLSRVLHPNRESVQEALRHVEHKTLTRLVSNCFDHSENTTNLGLLLYQSVHRARALYSPLHELLDVFPNDPDSVTQSQCNWAFDVFLQFDRLDNPFPCRDSNDLHEVRRCYSQLSEQLRRRLRKSRSRVRLLHHATTGSAICLIGTVIGVAISAAFIATHALAAIVATPICTASVQCDFKKKEVARVAQLDAAARGAYVLNNYLDNIDRLVARLHTAVEGDKRLVKLGLERGRERNPIHEVVKQLRKNHLNFIEQLRDFEEHLFLCFTMVNRARSQLLQEIHHHQSKNS